MLFPSSEGSRGRTPAVVGIVCNTLTGVFPIFRSPERHAFCTALATEVATAVAEVLAEAGVQVPIAPVALAEGGP